MKLNLVTRLLAVVALASGAWAWIDVCGDRGQAPRQPPHQGIGKINNPAADAPGFHDGAGEHEKGDGHEVKGVCAPEHPLDHHHQGKVPLDQYAQHGGDADGNGNGGINGKKDCQGDH